MIRSLTSHDDHLWVSLHIVWGLTNSGGWITLLVVGSGCVPPLDTTKWPGPEHKASLTRNVGVLKSRRDKLERRKKYRADLTHHKSSILLPSMWHRGAATLRSPPSNLLEPHVQCRYGFGGGVLSAEWISLRFLDLTGLKSLLQRVYGRVSPLWQL